jgi:hypothetical protein
VRLVDHEERDRAARDEVAQPAVERLGREVDELVVPSPEGVEPGARSSKSSVELISAARKPSERSASTWSFIRLIRARRRGPCRPEYAREAGR